MTQIEQLRKYIEGTHPETAVSLTPPLNKEGTWFLDVDSIAKHLVVEWSRATGFGISSLNDESYGERPDEAFRSVEDAQRRVSQLLTGNETTSPPLGVLLSRLRERRGRTQQELAAKLGIKQATVSGMERRDDIQFSTLRRVVEALGGMLEIFATFPEGRYRLGTRSVDLSVEPISQAPRYECAEAPSINYEETFEALHESGELPWAKQIAEDISSRRAVLEMAD